MELVKSLSVLDHNKERFIRLYAGDLSKITGEHAVDLLVVSAFPNSYKPVPETLVGALHHRGLSLETVASDKEHDLREVSGFWISKPLTGRYPNLNIGRIACFEPLMLGQPPQVVGELFRGLFPFLKEDRDSVVAMPLLSAGNQRWPPEAIFQPLMEAAYHWLQRGMPISELRIVEIRPDRVRAVAEQFDQFQDVSFTERLIPEKTSEPPTGGVDALSRPQTHVDKHYDVFLSYAEENQNAAQRLARALCSEIAGIRIFDYRLSIDIGKAWQYEIDTAIGGCKKIVALLSANYFASPECQEELMIARLRNKRSSFDVFFPLYWRDAGRALALWLQAITYSDCREADRSKLAAATKRIAAQLR